MKEKDKVLLKGFVGGCGILIVVTVAFLLLAPRVPWEEVPLLVTFFLGVSFVVPAIWKFTWGAFDRKTRSELWHDAFWRSIWGAQLFAILLLAKPLLQEMGPTRLFLLFTGFYVQTNGTYNFVRSLKERPLCGGTDLVVGLAAMSAALFLKR